MPEITLDLVQKNISSLAITLNTLQRLQLMSRDLSQYKTPIAFTLKAVYEALEYQKSLLGFAVQFAESKKNQS